MSKAKLNRPRRLDPHGPLVFDTRPLGSASALAETRVVPAPANLGSGLVHVPQGDDLELHVQLEDVSDGVLVTATVAAPLAGECARCLDEFTASVEVRFQELFAAEPGGSGDDGYLLEGDVLDLEPALRDALVLELPLSPLCATDCPGLCVTCGIKLADAEPGHRHADDGGVWAVLKNLFPPDPADEPPAGTQVRDAEADGPAAQADAQAAEAGPAGADRQDDTTLAGTIDPAGSKER
jgi:uncharacterized protein